MFHEQSEGNLNRSHCLDANDFDEEIGPTTRSGTLKLKSSSRLFLHHD